MGEARNVNVDVKEEVEEQSWKNLHFELPPCKEEPSQVHYLELFLVESLQIQEETPFFEEASFLHLQEKMGFQTHRCKLSCQDVEGIYHDCNPNKVILVLPLLRANSRKSDGMGKHRSWEDARDPL